MSALEADPENFGESRPLFPHLVKIFLKKDGCQKFAAKFTVHFTFLFPSFLDLALNHCFVE